MNLLMGAATNNAGKDSGLLQSQDEAKRQLGVGQGFDMTSLVDGKEQQQNKLRFTSDPQSFDLMSLFRR